MRNVMPSQVVLTVDELYPHAARWRAGDAPGMLTESDSSRLSGILSLVKAVPTELIDVSSSVYADFILAVSTIETQLALWRSRGAVGTMALVKGRDAVSIVRQVLAACNDEYPPPPTSELLFISDADLRENIRRDIGAVNRALSNAEWKAATVLAGATIEALLHWKLQEPPLNSSAIQAAVATVVAAKKCDKPNSDLDRWGLQQFIEVAAELSVIKADAANAARLAQNFRNLIHPGRAARLKQTCNRASALSAVGALEHVIIDLTRHNCPA